MIAVLDYGIGNLASAQRALAAAGADARLVRTATEAAGAEAVVLPGVGAFGACMAALGESGLDTVARQAVAEGTPFLGICVGMQMLYDGSDESPGVAGLGVLPGVVRRLRPKQGSGAKVPHLQWNRLDIARPSPLFEGLGDEPWVYFVHSYAAPVDGAVIATVEYGGEAVAVAVQQQNIWATQFHPEKSSATGLRLLRNFVSLRNPVRSRFTKHGEALPA